MCKNILLRKSIFLVTWWFLTLNFISHFSHAAKWVKILAKRLQNMSFEGKINSWILLNFPSPRRIGGIVTLLWLRFCRNLTDSSPQGPWASFPHLSSNYMVRVHSAYIHRHYFDICSKRDRSGFLNLRFSRKICRE